MKKRFGRTSRNEQQAFLDYGDRIVDGDTVPPANELESTFLKIQRAMRREASAPDTMPDHLRTRTWEDIMQNIATPTMRAPIGRHGQTGHRRVTPVALYRTPLHRMGWTGAANVALALLIVVAGFGAWRVFDGGMIGGGDNAGRSEGNYAFAPTTPVPMATADTDEVLTACDFSDEVPVYNGVDEPPVDGTVLYLTTSHNLMIHCDEEPEDVLLEESVDHVAATHWPGVVNLGIGVGDSEPTPVFLNLMTNERLAYGRENSAMTQQGTAHATMRSPFVVTAMPDDSSAWALTDLRSMETRALGELGGVEWPPNSSIYVSENGAQGTYAIAAVNDALTLERGPALVQPEGFPGEIMLVSGSLDDVSWIDVPEDLTSLYSIHVSPHGEQVAVMDVPRPDSQGEATIVVLKASDGTEVARTDTFEYTGSPNVLWVNDGEALVYQRLGALMLLEATEGSSPQPLLESDDRLFDLKATHDPEVVTISESDAPETEWSGESDRVHAVNARTGAIQSFEGSSFRPASFTLPALHSQSVIILADHEAGESGTTRVIDPSSGEILIELSIAPAENEPEPGRYGTKFPSGDTLALSINRETTAFSVREHGMLIVVDLSEEHPEVRELPIPEFTPPEGEWATQVDLSRDGTSLQLSVYNETVHMLWVMDLRDHKVIWDEIREGTWVSFMPAVP